MATDDVWADVLMMWRKDIYEMSGGEAVKLIERIWDVAPRDPEGKPLCSLYAWYERWKKAHPMEAVLQEDAQYSLMDDHDIEDAGGEVVDA